ncbi:hypothetical protein NDU88_002366 [Pleurodeles waltl]|uniref:Uncharacterized protein n=1 Tax=Pleurodeles waltl TaxID=8319 RepID=A0AAV7UVD6_PLEWA|nr:hypothetical protein NDU88_002366 [Pleurodeles waltl]
MRPAGPAHQPTLMENCGHGGRSSSRTRAGEAGCLLAHRLRAQAARRSVAELQLPDGTWACGDEQVIAQFERFYSDLYAAEGLDMEGVEAYLTSFPLAQIPSVDSEMLDGDITKEEVPAAIQRLPTGKVPGPDSFSVEYYRAFGPLLAPVLTRLYKELGAAAPLPSPTSHDATRSSDRHP